MYGTIGRLCIKGGAEAELIAQLDEFSDARVAGARALYLCRLDPGLNCFYTVLVFDSKESYLTFRSGGQTLFEDLAPLLQAAPQWTEGEIVYESDIPRGGL